MTIKQYATKFMESERFDPHLIYREYANGAILGWTIGTYMDTSGTFED